MSRILVIGGYGGFGARLCRRLSAAGHHLLVAGRSEQKARRFCSGLGAAEAVVLDRSLPVGEVLARYRPDLVIDAAGPFQGSGYDVARACIADAVPYLDLADARDFVAGIGALDEAARAAGVAVISGASSSPALTGAIVRKLAAGLDRVHSVDIALSAANRASGGEAVIAAILSYVGRPVRVWRGGRWSQAFGSQELRREDFLFSDGSGLRGRLVALADLPDCELLPPSLPGRPAVTFRVGTELGFQMLGLWLASWPVRWGWAGSLNRGQAWLIPLYRLSRRLGGKRSAMSIALKGRAGTRSIERRWTIVAERGEGMEVPTLAGELLAEEILAGRIAAGARDATSLLSLDRFEPAFSRLAVRYEIEERTLPPPLYARIFGAAFRHLPPMVRAIHDVDGDAGAAGEGRVVRGTSWPARLIAALMRFPPEGSWPLHVAFSERGGIECWTRDFGGHRFSSELSARGRQIAERFGPIRFDFDLPAGDRGLEMRLKRWSLFRVPLPLALAPRISAREFEAEGRFRFDVDVAMPLVGRVVHYSGWLKPLLFDAEAEKKGATRFRAAPTGDPIFS